MKLFNLNLAAGVLGFGLLLTPTAPGQTQDQPKITKDSTVNLTGCLVQGSRTNEYSVKDSNGNTYELRPAAGIRMKKHVGHEVMITGNIIKHKSTANDEYLRVNQLKMVNSSCS